MSNKILRGLLLAPTVALLAGCQTVLMSPKGDVALQQRDLIITSLLLMLTIIIPVIALTFIFAWRYRASNKSATYKPDWEHSTVLELLIWSAPLLIIIALGALTWVSAHKLDPYRQLDRISAGKPVPADAKPLVVDVVALDWKWLFFYPEQGIATVNELAAPVDRPIEFHITASNVMNSFFIPSLAGQIYAMPGMETSLHAVINHPGEFQGFSANYSGAGFSHMRFKFYGMSDSDFASWVAKAKASGDSLSRVTYDKLQQPSENEPVHRYSSVAAGLYDDILNRCIDSTQTCLKNTKGMDMHGDTSSHDGTSAAPPSAMTPSRPTLPVSPTSGQGDGLATTASKFVGAPVNASRSPL